MTIKVERSDAPVRPFTVWFQSNKWSDLTMSEARALCELLQHANADEDTSRLIHIPIEAIKEDVRA